MQHCNTLQKSFCDELCFRKLGMILSFSVDERVHLLDDNDTSSDEPARVAVVIVTDVVVDLNEHEHTIKKITIS